MQLRRGRGAEQGQEAGNKFFFVCRNFVIWDYDPINTALLQIFTENAVYLVTFQSNKRKKDCDF